MRNTNKKIYNNKVERKAIGARMPIELFTQIQDFAKKENRNFSNALAQLASEGLLSHKSKNCYNSFGISPKR